MLSLVRQLYDKKIFHHLKLNLSWVSSLDNENTIHETRDILIFVCSFYHTTRQEHENMKRKIVKWHLSSSTLPLWSSHFETSICQVALASCIHFVILENFSSSLVISIKCRSVKWDMNNSVVCLYHTVVCPTSVAVGNITTCTGLGLCVGSAKYYEFLD